VLELLRKTGQTLSRELSGVRHTAEVLSRGAAGDKTHPVDKRAEEIILSALESWGEPLTVISEEAGVVEMRGGGMTVIVDPIDGSRNAVSGIPFYCSSLAVAEGECLEDVVLSYIINLANGEEFWADVREDSGERGAFGNGRPLYTQKDDVPRVALFEAQTPARDIPCMTALLTEFRRARCLGAVALDMAYLAAGSATVFVNPAPSRSFDFAGGWLMVREAGGMVTDLGGEDLGKLRLGLTRESPFLASGNEAVHERALALLSG
jgi:myo-inositol-1(or 4)-monophosphatase